MNVPTSKIELALKARKRKFGLNYGIAGGLAFALALWGYDGLALSQANALFPWLKLLVGGSLSIIAGGLAGWLTSRFESPLLAVPFWLTASGLLGLFTVIVPLVIAPWITGILAPQIRPFLQYTPHNNLPVMVAVASTWVVVSSIIVAIVQIPLLEQAAFSLSGFEKIRPHLLCAFLLIVSGSVADSLHNRPLRDPIIGLNETIQFSLDTRGQEVDKIIARQKHVAALRPVLELVQPNRNLIVSRYDPFLENIYVLADFGESVIECATFYGNPSNCKPVLP